MKLAKAAVLLTFAFLTLARTKASADETNAPTQLQLEMLKSILADANEAAKGNDPDARGNDLREFLTKSEQVGDISILTNLWIQRADAALELNDDQRAWEAGQKLLGFHLDHSDDPKLQRLMVTLERKGLLDATSPAAKTKAEQQRQAVETRHTEASEFVGTWRLSSDADETVCAHFDKYDGSITITVDTNYNLHVTGNFTCHHPSQSGLKDAYELTGKIGDIAGQAIQAMALPDLESGGSRGMSIELTGDFDEKFIPKLFGGYRVEGHRARASFWLAKDSLSEGHLDISFPEGETPCNEFYFNKE
jgi:hypothetical protein